MDENMLTYIMIGFIVCVILKIYMDSDAFNLNVLFQM